MHAQTPLQKLYTRNGNLYSKRNLKKRFQQMLLQMGAHKSNEGSLLQALHMHSFYRRSDLWPRCEVGSICPGVVGNRVSQMITQILQRSLACDDGLHEESKHGEHGKPPILELLHLQFSESVRVVSQAQGIEWAPWVDRIHHITQWTAGNAVTLHRSHQDNLNSPDGENALGMNERWVAQIV